MEILIQPQAPEIQLPNTAWITSGTNIPFGTITSSTTGDF